MDRTMDEERYILRSARFLAADVMRRILRPGDVAVDATMGNGGDTQLLCELVGDTGHVYAFDVQPEAIKRTRARLQEVGFAQRATLFLAGHETMAARVTEPVQGVMFNLGWLPGAAHELTTRVETTLTAVAQACGMLLPGGAMTVCIYPGHQEGRLELNALLQWAGGLDVRRYNALWHRFVNAAPDTPQMLFIQHNMA